MVKSNIKVFCDYCGKEAILAGGNEIYPHRKDLYNRKFWLCKSCNAYVGTHKNHTPLGKLANKDLRIKRIEAHSVFDHIWKKNIKSRDETYKWLSKKLEISTKQCHIGMFDLDMCEKVISICTNSKNK